MERTILSKVYLIGAGPGDPGLITLKGKELLARADVVIYDHLAAEDLLRFARPGAELVYVGKSGADHTLPQEQINALVIDKAKSGKTVVRLKGGDPYVFGRGGEEAEELAAAGIDFEVVPGVSSGAAAPACAGIPLTHRSCASSVIFATGHENPDKEQSAHNWEAMAKSGSTLVFYMGVKNLPEIVRRLIDNGLSEDTPAALIQWGTTPKQRSLLTTLGRAATDAVEKDFAPPSIFLVGKVALLRERLNTFEKRPLFGKGIVVTRSREQASDTAARLAELGARVLVFPTIAVAPFPDDGTSRSMPERLSDYGLIVFTSVNGVRFFFARLAARGRDARALAGADIACIGPGTASALQSFGLKADLLPEKFVAESVAEAVFRHYPQQVLAEQRVLLPRAKQARDALPRLLASRCKAVDILELYETKPGTAHKDSLLEELEAGRIDCVTFASSSTVKNFLDLIPAEVLRRRPGLKFACIGPITAATLEEAGLVCHIQPEEHTIPALVKALRENLAD
ncbi:MAG: uroporphyrinogen-III C-methyltransferase [Desulfovibrio sp.]|jgi:uroporphyrinogen III methyltransferase/synthase|nr:uroporphyrinogen-III C-methyltransferase [Desulfovibrio sp.]